MHNNNYHTLQALQLSSNDVQALKRMGLSKIDVEEVEELARSVARQMKAQMETRGRFQSVNQDYVLSEVKMVGTSGPKGVNVPGDDEVKDAAVEQIHNHKIENVKEVVSEEQSKSDRLRRGVSLGLSAGLHLGWGGHRRHKHGGGELRLKIDKFHDGGRYGDGSHHNHFGDNLYYEEYRHYDDHHHHKKHHVHHHYHDYDDYHDYHHHY